MKHKDEMSFFEHLEDLRWHLIRSIFAILIITVVVFIFKDFVFNNIIFAPKSKDFPTYRFFCRLSEITCFFPPEFEVQTRKLEETFVTHIKASVVIGFVVAFPYFFWEIWKFVRPGLMEKEVKAVKGVVFVCSLLFFLGVLFGYFVVTPFAITFLASYQLGDVLFEPSLSSYINNMVMYALPVGLVFEMPVLILALTKIGVVSSSFLKKQRKIAFILLITLSAIVTPPDVFTQFIIGIPLYLLFEVSILLSQRIEKKQKAAENE